MDDVTLNVRVELGRTGLSAGDATEAVSKEMLRLKEILFAQDDQTAIPDGGNIFDRSGEHIGSWWKQ